MTTVASPKVPEGIPEGRACPGLAIRGSKGAEQGDVQNIAMIANEYAITGWDGTYALSKKIQNFKLK